MGLAFGNWMAEYGLKGGGGIRDWTKGWGW